MARYLAGRWRLIRSAAADGATNMAVDEAILGAVVTGQVRPTLRLYAWAPACLSLGRAQEVADVDQDGLAAAGFDLVRRPTGGKAIFHVDELTYSVIAPQTDPRVAGSIVESYRRLSRGLVRGLERLGLAGIIADRRSENRARDGGPVCFEVPSDYEITYEGRKLVGSAQQRANGGVLQHGTLPLEGDVARICRYLVSRPDPLRVRGRATTVEEALGRMVTWDEAADAVATGFAEALDLRFELADLTAAERVRVADLHETKYATEMWTCRV